MRQTKLKEWRKKKERKADESFKGACGSICGGIISESDFNKHLKNKTLEQVAMAWVLPDKWYKKYWELIDKGEHEKAKKIFERYAWNITG